MELKKSTIASRNSIISQNQKNETKMKKTSDDTRK